MKTSYFTTDNIEDKSFEMIKKIKNVVHLRNIPFNPPSSALVVLDMQKYFLKESSHAFIPSALPIIPNIKKMIEEFYRKNIPVIFTRHINPPGQEGRMAKWWKNLIREDNPDSEIIEDLDISKGIIVEKSQYDAFFKTPLEKILSGKNLSQLVITGVMTNLCCETTARSSFIRGFDVFFTIDGTATYNEEFHFSAILNLSFGFAIPVMSREIIERVREI